MRMLESYGHGFVFIRLPWKIVLERLMGSQGVPFRDWRRKVARKKKNAKSARGSDV